MFTHTHIHINMHHTRIHTLHCTHTHAQTHTHAHTKTHTHVHRYTHTHTHRQHTHTRMHTHKHTGMHTHTHIHTHTQTHIQTHIHIIMIPHNSLQNKRGCFYTIINNDTEVTATVAKICAHLETSARQCQVQSHITNIT